ncbi:hypothetical protein IV102_26675 [bacterium]|nr:hypothetical protein [bacterium]
MSLMGQVATLTQQVLTLQKRLEAMEELTRTNSTNSSKPPSADPPGTLRNRKETSGKSRGGQPGHKGYHQYTLVGECKWTNRPIGMTEWQKLRDKAQVLTQEIPLYYLFSRSGFSPELRDQTQVRCVGLEELLETVPH